MSYAFDTYGWFTGQTDEGGRRTTEIAPPGFSTSDTPGEPRALWLETAWALQAYAPPPEPDTLAERKAAMQEAIRQKRWEVETGGTTLNGSSVLTTESSQNKIAGAIQLFDKDPTLEALDFEIQPGVWVTLGKVQIEAIGVAVGRFIQACFSHCRGLSEAIAAAEDHDDLDEIDIHSGWPS